MFEHGRGAEEGDADTVLTGRTDRLRFRRRLKARVKDNAGRDGSIDR